LRPAFGVCAWERRAGAWADTLERLLREQLGPTVPPASGLPTAAKPGQLTIAKVDAHGKLSLVARVPTHAGARNPAVTDKGVVYLAHSGMSGLSDLVVVELKK